MTLDNDWFTTIVVDDDSGTIVIKPRATLSRSKPELTPLPSVVTFRTRGKNKSLKPNESLVKDFFYFTGKEFKEHDKISKSVIK